MELESRTTHGVQLQLGMPLLLRRASHLRQVRDGPRLPHREGRLRRVALDGLKFILVAAWPKAIHLGHGRGVLFLDAQATGPKREALEAIATARPGDP